MRLVKKIFIKGSIEAVTGMHIGGSKSSLDIGGIDLNVIKTSTGVPFIPGSSLKGKLRSILAREFGSQDVKDDPESVQRLFGSANEGREERASASRVLVRDAFLDEPHFRQMQQSGAIGELEMEFTEGKWENTINRRTGTAEHPRQLERVPSGVRFNYEIVLNIFETDTEAALVSDLLRSMLILQDDYLGGQGSRGYGKVRFVDTTITEKTVSEYEQDAPAKPTNYSLGKGS